MLSLYTPGALRSRWAVDTDDNAASTVTLAATATVRWIIKKIVAGYNIPPTTGTKVVTIAFTQDGQSVTITIPVCYVNGFSAYVIDMNFPENCLIGDVNTAITITLSASGASGTFGYLNVAYA